jgi:hypothetical protein
VGYILTPLCGCRILTPTAVKFFLSTRTEELREKADVQVTAASPAALDDAVRRIYGVNLTVGARNSHDQ